ncbi:hypothetical protein ACHAXR_010336 [Thalassiosira sp. AJA248-18]
MLTNKSRTVGPIALILCNVIVFAASVVAISPPKQVGWISSAKTFLNVEKHRGNTFVNIPRGGDVDADGDGRDADVIGLAQEEEKKRLVIIIDVDNTLYSEQGLLSSTGYGIETQIVKNTHLFGLLHFNLTSQQCDDLYTKYGSTIEGLRHTLPSDQVEETMARFYREVYDAIDFSCLLGTTKNEDTKHNEDKVRSGYDHGHALQQRRALAEFLKSMCKVHPVYLASNSPKAHIGRAVNGLGLGGVDFAGVLSPDMDNNASTQTDPDNHPIIYPTKSSPRQYYQHILDRHPPSSNRIILLDDSMHNIREAESVGIEGIHINHSGRTVEEGLAEALGHILPSESNDVTSGKSSYTFSDGEYLLAKNKVDIQAINPSVWEQLAQQLALRIQQNANGNRCTLRIADLGAGMLSMLELIMSGGGKEDRQKPSMLMLINTFLGQDQIRDVEYFAYESNLNLLKDGKKRLESMGFREINDNSSDDGASFTTILSDPATGNDIEITIHLRPTDYQSEQIPPKGLDLIIGCCFADLFDPGQLALSMKKFSHGESPPLVYFPITFAGTTQFSSAFPSVPSQASRNQCIPSDTTAFRLYSESLTAHGHNLDPALIVNAISDYGGSLISKGSSDWIINPSLDQYLWETMLYFFGMSGAREMAMIQLDSAGWIQQCRRNPRAIIVSNVDLLFRLQADYRVAPIDSADNVSSKTVSVQEIQFVAPYNVTTVTKRWDTTDSGHLSHQQVEIESVCSLISSGTELKVFKGSFEGSSSLDVCIKGMADKPLEYPVAYGYSLVGRVVACGSHVTDAESLIGKLVFTFSPHSSRVIVDRDAIQLVPDGVNTEDAMFMPSVETALSVVHDAHIRMGENVAVFGQGLIGLLVTSIISMQSPPSISSSGCFSSVTAFDTENDRLRVASSLGATSALAPNAVAAAGPFDVAIEVSGNPRALQSAIDHTSNNGRVIVGSWYGNADVALKLGTDFHRSHKTIMTSQVSNIPPAMAGLWSKERRFKLTWSLVKFLRPSRLITKRMTLNDAQQAYELLDARKESIICFKYD